jgi:hypothetical protein
MPSLLALAAEALGFLPLLLLPVILLLFLNLRFSRRLRYPHYLIVGSERKGPAALLFRSFRTWYDVLLDAAIALVLAFALASFLGEELRGGRRAVVVDCSRSMLAGRAGERPLDRAAARLLGDPALADADPFALAFVPERMEHRLLPLAHLRGELESAEAPELARRLERGMSFFTADYGLLGELSRRGYGEVILLTDRLPGKAEGFRAIELGWASAAPSEGEASRPAAAPRGPDFGESGAWPTAARYDRLAESWVIVLAESGARAPLSLQAWSEEIGAFAPLPADSWSIEERPGGRALRVEEPGTYLLSLGGPGGIPGADFPLRLQPARLAAAASGPFSEAMLQVFPLLEELPRPELYLVDSGTAAARARLPAGSRRILTDWKAGGGLDGSALLDPALSGGRLIAVLGESGGIGDRRLVPGASGLANPDLPLYYDGLILAGEPPAFATSLPRGSTRLRPAGSAYMAIGPWGETALIAPEGEFFEPARNGLVGVRRSRPARLPWALVLLGLALLKLRLWRSFSGKPLLRAETGT